MLCEEEYKEGTKLDTKIVEKLGLTKKINLNQLDILLLIKRLPVYANRNAKREEKFLNALVSSENIRNLIESMIFLDEKLQERKKYILIWRILMVRK